MLPLPAFLHSRLLTLLSVFVLCLVAPFAAEAGDDAWDAYRLKREAQTEGKVADLDLLHNRWLLRSRSLESVYLGFPMTQMTYDKRYILPDADAFAEQDEVFREPKVGLRMGPDGLKLAFVGMPFEKQRKLYDLTSKTRVRVELFFDRKRIAYSDVFMVNPVAFLLPMHYLDEMDEAAFLAQMQSEWQWRVRVFYDEDVGFVYSGPLADADKALAAARDELAWRQARKAQGAISPTNQDFW